MDDYFESFSEDIKKWDLVKNMIDLDLDDGRRKDHKTIPSVQLLPRRDVMLYGTIPKMEQRIYTKCKECRLVFNPRDIISHKACPGKSHSFTSHSLKKKVKSKGNATKKSHSNLPPPPLFKKSPSLATSSVSIPDIPLTKVASPKILKISTVSTSTTFTTCSSSSKSDTRVSSSTSSNSHSPRSPLKTSSSNSEHSPKSKPAPLDNICSSTSSRHKKSRKSNSNTKIIKEFDPDVHCGVVEGNRGPCTRSITCNNHRIQLRKLVTGRSKDIHQLIAERKTVKEKEPKHGSNCSYTSPNGQAEEIKESFSQITTYAPVVGALSSANEPQKSILNQMPVLPKISEPKPTTPVKQTTSAVAPKQPLLTDTENGNTRTLNHNYIKNMHLKESDIEAVPVVYMPMSLISFVQIGKSVICLKSQQSQTQSPPVTNQSLYLAIPNQHSNTKMYKSHPKPVAVPNYGAKKVGGAILLSNQRIECQRNDILMAINTKRKTINNTQGYRTISLLNHTNVPHRPNILKVKSANKVNCKRSSVDKMSTCDSKQMRLTKLVGSFCSPI